MWERYWYSYLDKIESKEKKKSQRHREEDDWYGLNQERSICSVGQCAYRPLEEERGGGGGGGGRRKRWEKFWLEWRKLALYLYENLCALICCY